MYQIKLEKFEGPLDLLLSLIEEEKLDITEVSLAKVTDQYILYLEKAQDLPTEELADFLVVAAKLLYIKSKILLPMVDLGEEEEGDLEKQLKIYKIFLEAAQKINKIIRRKKYAYFKENPKYKYLEPIFTPPANISNNQLKILFLDILGQIEPIVRLPQDVIKKTISIQEKINDIRKIILAKASVSFENLLAKAKDKTEVIVTFLALLELVKQRSIQVVQSKNFSDIQIQKTREKELINH